jgi:membrane-bound lytic murein transglycosylase D
MTMMSKWFKNFGSPSFNLLSGALIMFAFIAILSFTGIEENNNPFDNKPIQVASPFTIPNEMIFAGESVPLDNFDTRESLDREMLVNAYWHSRTLLVLKKSKRYFAIIEPILKKYSIPEDFKYLPMAESGFENVVSGAGAAGVWQIVEKTAKEYGLEINDEVDERYHLEKSTEVACKFLLESYSYYNNWTLTAASYNVGRKGINDQIERQQVENYYDLLLNEETARYVFRVLSFKLIAQNPEAYGFQLESGDYYPPMPNYEVKVDSAVTNFAQFAASYSINYKILKLFNPWLRENFLTNKTGKSYMIKIPEGSKRSYPEIVGEINEESNGKNQP